MTTLSLLMTTLFLVILGWLLGSLINYLADVLPYTRRLTPAACFGCARPRPIMEYLLMQPCKVCGQQRRMRAWTVQVLAVVITLVLWFYPFSRVGFWVGTILLTYFGVVAVIDIEHRLILYMESAAGAVIGFFAGLGLHGFVPTLMGGLAGLAIMAGLYLLGWALARLFGKLRGQPIEEEALGFSDILLCGVLGLILGWPGIAVGVFSTIFIAGAGSLIILLSQVFRRNYQPFAPVAYGPYLLLAAVLLLYWPK
jgi:leader peptidase (prepilin peptidase)/N-methyltransferase